MNNLELALAYLDKLPVAQSGAGGHNATLQAALACRRFGLSEAEAWQALTWYNDFRCSPKWSERELRHKLESVSGLAVKKPLGQQRRMGKARVQPFTPPASVERKPDPRPVCQRSAADEELWWAKQAADMGLSLAEFDAHCGIETELTL